MLLSMPARARLSSKSNSMSYELGFLDEALKEWRKLDSNLREQFNTRLMKRLNTPSVLSTQLSGHADRYKIKPHCVGYRLVYEVRDEQFIVVVIAVGKRERNAVYKTAAKR